MRESDVAGEGTHEEEMAFKKSPRWNKKVNIKEDSRQ